MSEFDPDLYQAWQHAARSLNLPSGGPLRKEMFKCFQAGWKKGKVQDNPEQPARPTHDQVRAALKAVSMKHDAEDAVILMRQIADTDRLSRVAPRHYAALIEAAEKRCAEAPDRKIEIQSHLRPQYTYVLYVTDSGDVRKIVAGCRVWKTFAEAFAHYDGDEAKWDARTFVRERRRLRREGLDVSDEWDRYERYAANRREAKAILNRLQEEYQKATGKPLPARELRTPPVINSADWTGRVEDTRPGYVIMREQWDSARGGYVAARGEDWL